MTGKSQNPLRKALRLRNQIAIEELRLVILKRRLDGLVCSMPTADLLEYNRLTRGENK